MTTATDVSGKALAVGDWVKCVRADGFAYGHLNEGKHYRVNRVQFGEVGLDGVDSGTWNANRFVITTWVKDESPAPAVDTTERDALIRERDEARAERDRARRELFDFRTQVRDAVISEAQEQGWCSRTDEWLEELGLERRDPTHGMPVGRYAVVRLTNGNHAVREDTDGSPWRERNSDGYAVQWMSFEDVARRHQATIFEGDEGDEYDPDN